MLFEDFKVLQLFLVLKEIGNTNMVKQANDKDVH